MRNRQGFTLIEVIMAVVVLSVGVLGMLTTFALVTRMVGRGSSANRAANFAEQRLERLRQTGCTSQASSSDTLYRGTTSTWVAINSWTFTNGGGSTWHVRLLNRYKTSLGATRTDTVEASLSCTF